MYSIFGVILMLAAGFEPAHAYTIQNDRGGMLDQYVQRFRSIAASGERVVVDGPCYSACTLVLTYVPRDRICATSRAMFGFHRAYTMDMATGRNMGDSYDDTMRMIQSYPTNIQSWIQRRGGAAAMPSGGFWTMSGSEAGLRRC